MPSNFATYAGLSIQLVALAISTYVSYDIQSKGAIPEKQLELFEGMQFDPLVDLSAFGDRARVEINAGGQTVRSFVVAHADLTNTGSAPIVPADFSEPLRVSVEAPVRILAVESDFPIRLDWSRITDQTFEAKPALLNPGDRVNTKIYIHDPNRPIGHASMSSSKVALRWTARIVNMRRISPRPPYEFPTLRDPVVHASGGGVALMIGLALVFMSGLMLQLRALKARLRRDGILEGGAVILSLVGYSSAEAWTHIITGGWLPDLYPPVNPLNISVIAVHVAVMVALQLANRGSALRRDDTGNRGQAVDAEGDQSRDNDAVT